MMPLGAVVPRVREHGRECVRARAVALHQPLLQVAEEGVRGHSRTNAPSQGARCYACPPPNSNLHPALSLSNRVG